MTWIHPLAAETEESADVLGGKAHGLVVLLRLGLPVPPGFVIGTGACRAFLRDGRLPDGLDVELAAAVAELEAATGRPPAVSVRSGGRESMPGMMTTILNLPVRQVEPAVVEVLSSWDTPRAQTYRELHGIPHHLGTAVTVQAMVFGNRDNHSGSGVAFSRNPNTGEQRPSARSCSVARATTSSRADPSPGPCTSWPTGSRPCGTPPGRPAPGRGPLPRRVPPGVHLRGRRLWLLQVRPGRFAGDAAVRVATDLADEGVIGRGEALLRVSPRQLQHVRIPRIATVDEADVLARGWVPARALPWAGSRPPPTTRPGWPRTARSSWSVRRPPARPARPGRRRRRRHRPWRAASHAAVVARAMGKPAVGIAGLTSTSPAPRWRAGGGPSPKAPASPSTGPVGRSSSAAPASSRPPPVRTGTDCSAGPTRSRAAPRPTRGRTARRGPGRPRWWGRAERGGPDQGDRGRGWSARGCGTPPAGRAGRPGA